MKLKTWIGRIWKDPVWSKVIATVILSILAALWAVLMKNYFPSWWAGIKYMIGNFIKFIGDTTEAWNGLLLVTVACLFLSGMKIRMYRKTISDLSEVKVKITDINDVIIKLKSLLYPSRYNYKFRTFDFDQIDSELNFESGLSKEHLEKVSKTLGYTVDGTPGETSIRLKNPTKPKQLRPYQKNRWS